MWWFILLLLLFAVLLGPLIWAMFRVSKLRFADARGQVVAPEQVPESVLWRLKEQVDPLMHSGFEYLGMRQESRGDGNYWQTFLTSAGGMVYAVVEESDEKDAGRRVNLMSFDSHGSASVTADGEGVFGAEWPGAQVRRGAFGSALEQAESHASLLTEESVPVVAVDPGAFLDRYERMSAQGLDHLFERGWLKETKEETLSVPLFKLPQVTVAWVKHELAERGRKKSGSSWLLGNYSGEELAESSFEEEIAEEDLAEEVSAEAAVVADEPAILGEQMPDAEAGSADLVAEVEGEGDGIEEAVALALAANERALDHSQMEAMPVGPMDGKEEDVLKEEGLPEDAVADEPAIAADESAIVADESAVVEDEPAIQIPEEDGLARDWALYQQQASQKSWAYWLGGFGGRALLFLSLLVFSLWMASSAGWGLRVVLFGVLALLVHEVGHAVMMWVRRSWDWSQFLIPMPHAMRAHQWSIKGGWGELFTILAGPLPGLAAGWFVLVSAYFGAPSSDLVLDLALAAVVVNSVTLLPFLPLDGGRLLDLAFLRRIPQLRAIGLVVAGFAFFALIPFGGGLIAGVLGLLMWVAIPAARRRSKLLPWLRANSKEDEEEQVVTAFSISRERSQRKAFNKASGMARIDELMGLAKAQKVGFLGGLVALFVLAFSWLAPLALPASSIASKGLEWFQLQKEVKSEANFYLGELRPIKDRAGKSPEKEAEERSDAVADLESWRERLQKDPGRADQIFGDQMELDAVRTMNWLTAAHWIAEKPRERQIVAREAAEALRRAAIRSADSGNDMQAFRDLSVAFRVIIECEPRSSLEAWVAWLELEREVLKEVEDVSSRYTLADTFLQWYEGALERFPRPTNRKLGGLLLAESQDLESLVKDLNVKAISAHSDEGGVGRKFLSSYKGVGQLVSVDALQRKREFAESFARSSSLKAASEELGGSPEFTPELADALQRINSNYAFRQIAMAALKVKRVGMQGAAQELAELTEDFGFTSHLEETDERKSLKLSRHTASGEVVEMEWLLQQ